MLTGIFCIGTFSVMYIYTYKCCILIKALCLEQKYLFHSGDVLFTESLFNQENTIFIIF